MPACKRTFFLVFLCYYEIDLDNNQWTAAAAVVATAVSDKSQATECECIKRFVQTTSWFLILDIETQQIEFSTEKKNEKK